MPGSSPTLRPLRAEAASLTVENLYARHYRRRSQVYLLTLLAVMGGLAALPFITVDVGTTTRATIRTSQQPVAVTAATSGQVVFSRLEDNAFVKTGDTLLIVDDSELSLQNSHQRQQLDEHRLLLGDLAELLAALEDGHSPQLQTAIYQRDYQEYRQLRDAVDLKLRYEEQQLSRQEKLFATGTIAAIEIEQYRFNNESARNECLQLAQRKRHLWAQEQQRYRREATKLRSSIQTLHQRSRQYVLIAPATGHLTQVAGITTGAYVSLAQPLANISPQGDLEVALAISPRDIGLLREGLPVSLQMDAYNHSQWGLAHATITEIGQDASAGQQGQPVFLAVARLETPHLVLSGGQKGLLKKGMTGTAHLSLARRSLFQLLNDQLHDWLPQA